MRAKLLNEFIESELNGGMLSVAIETPVEVYILLACGR